MEYNTAFNVVDTGYGVALGVFLRVSSAYEHYADGGARVKFYFALVEIDVGNPFKQVDNVTLEAQHDAFSLRVAHAAVIFYDHRVALYVDKSEENEAFVVESFFGKSFYGRTDYTVFNFLHPLFCGKWYRRYAAHSARVEPRVVLADTLIVLCFRQDFVVPTVCKHEHRAFNATKEFLDDNVCRCVSEHTTQHFA